MYNKRRLTLSIIWIIIGVILVYLSCTDAIDSSMFIGFGGGLTAIGLFQVIRHIRYRSDSAYREKLDIAQTDERYRYISLRAWAVSGYATLIVTAICGVVAYIQGKSDVAESLLCLVAFVALAYSVAFFVLNKKC